MAEPLWTIPEIAAALEMTPPDFSSRPGERRLHRQPHN